MSGSAVKCHTCNFLHKLKRDGTGKMIFLNLLTIRCTLALPVDGLSRMGRCVTILYSV